MRQRNVGVEKVLQYKIFTMDNCIFCVRAKMLFNKHGASYTEKRLSEIFKKVECVNVNKWAKDIPHITWNNGAIGGNRTHDLRITNAPLYPLATMAQI